MGPQQAVTLSVQLDERVMHSSSIDLIFRHSLKTCPCPLVTLITLIYFLFAVKLTLGKAVSVCVGSHRFSIGVINIAASREYV